MGRVPHFNERTTFLADEVLQLDLASCYFELRAKVPSPTVFESIRMIDYFPALQQISNQCLETPEGYSGGRIPVGTYFVAGLGAEGVLEPVRNKTVVRGGMDNGSSARIGVVTA